MRKSIALIVLAFCVVSAPLVASAERPRNYRHAKTMIDKIYSDYPVTTYCGCLYDGAGHHINARSCGLSTDKYRKRARRVEWEHVMPASYFGRKMPCWHRAPKGESGRHHCEDTSDAFNTMEGDLYNLQPSVGALNAIRSDHPYGMIAGEKRAFGQCDFEDSGYVTEPPPWFRGDAARTWFYMSKTYGIPIEPGMRAMFERWAREDPPDAWEIERARRIGNIQGQDYTVHFGR